MGGRGAGGANWPWAWSPLVLSFTSALSWPPKPVALLATLVTPTTLAGLSTTTAAALPGSAPLPLPVLQQQWELTSRTMAIKAVAIEMPSQEEPGPSLSVKTRVRGQGNRLLSKYARASGVVPAQPAAAPAKASAKASTLSVTPPAARVKHCLATGGLLCAALARRSVLLWRAARRKMRVAEVKEKKSPTINSAS